MIITEFLQGRNVERQAVTRYIARHQELFKGHTTKKGKELEIDEVAYEILDKKYPYPNPIQIVEDTEAKKQLELAKDQIIQLQQALLNAQTQVLELKSQVALIEVKDTQLEFKDQKIVELETEISKLMNRNILERILNKK